MSGKANYYMYGHNPDEECIVFVLISCRVLSNSAPTYLEGMQRTLMFTDSIDAKHDMMLYVESQPKLKEKMKRPKFEQFQSRVST